MELRFAIPLQFYISGKSKESLSLATSFTKRKIACSMTLIGDKPIEYPEPPDEDTKYFMSITKLSFTLTDNGATDLLRKLVEEKPHFNLVKFLSQTANRCLRAIRNIENLAGIREYFEKEISNAKYVLNYWNVEYQNEQGNWIKIIEPSGDEWIQFLSRNLPFFKGGDLHVAFWELIEEYIQDDLQPPPEKEFLVNALEYSQIGNFRLALLEAVIGLEVVLTGYLKRYMKIIKKLSKDRIEKFLDVKFGLSARVSGLLNLTISDNIEKKINIKAVLRGVKWRNKIMHNDGNLPQSVRIEELSTSISSILQLSQLLGKETNGLIAKPVFDQISQKIRSKYDYSWPTIRLIERHLVHIKFGGFDFDEFPTKDEIIEIARDYVDDFKNRDPRFDVEKHLWIQIVEYPDNMIKASWLGGRYTVFREIKK